MLLEKKKDFWIYVYITGQQRYCKLKPSKCDFFKAEVRHFGRIVSAEVCRVDPAGFEAVRALKDM